MKKNLPLLILAIMLSATVSGQSSNYEKRIRTGMPASKAIKTGKSQLVNQPEKVQLQAAAEILALDSIVGISEGEPFKQEYKYNTIGQVIEIIETDPVDNERDRTVFAYNAAGEMTNEFSYKWSIATSAWIPAEETQYVYANGDGLLTTENFYDYNGSGMELVAKTDYTYDGGVLTSNIHAVFDNGDWNAIDKTEYTYQADGLIETETNYSMNSVGVWEVNSKSTNMYNEAGYITLSTWAAMTEGGSLADMQKEEYFYDALNNLIQYTMTERDSPIDEWGLDIVTDITYDLNYPVSMLFIPQEMSDMGIQFMIVKDETTGEDGNGVSNYFYSPYQPGDDGVTESRMTETEVYMNRANGSINIGNLDGTAVFSLFSTQGVLLLSTEVNSDSEIQAQSLPSGIYLYSLQQGADGISGKLVK